MDELTLTLPRKIRKETRAAVEAAGGTWDAAPGRGGHRPDGRGVRPQGQVRRAPGSTTTPTAGGPGCGRACASELGATNHDVDLHELSERMLVIEAIETVRCFDEGVLTSVPDANIGSIFGIGFPAWTGGVVQYVEGFPGGVGRLRGPRRRARREVRHPLHRAGVPARPRGSHSANGTLAHTY